MNPDVPKLVADVAFVHRHGHFPFEHQPSRTAFEAVRSGNNARDSPSNVPETRAVK